MTLHAAPIRRYLQERHRTPGKHARGTLPRFNPRADGLHG